MKLTRTGLWGLIVTLGVIVLLSDGACRKKEKHQPPASPSPASQRVAKPHSAPSASQEKYAPTFKGYTIKIEDAEKKGNTIVVNVRITNESSKKSFKKMIVVLEQYDSGRKLLSSQKKTADISALRPGSSRDVTLNFSNPHPRLKDIEVKISGLR